MDLTGLLAQAQQGNQQAEQQLRALEEQDFAKYIMGMVTELGTASKPANTRQLAGLQLKNTMTSREAGRAELLARRWLSVPDNIRLQTRGMVLQILADPNHAIRSTAAQVVAAIASIEVPRKKWDELIGGLVHNITQNPDNLPLRQASFEALGYVCEECADQEQLHNQSNAILTAINTGMKAEEQSNDIKLVATKALVNSLEFARGNFENEKERNLILGMVFNSTQCQDQRVRVEAMQCLVQIASLYYKFLGAYIKPIFELTCAAMKGEKEEVRLQAIEFWSTVCDVELELLEDEMYAQEKNAQPEIPCANYAKLALQGLVPIILETLKTQSEEVDDDTWSPAMAAGVCLGLLAKTTQNHIVSHVLPFVQGNIMDADWRKCEAATLAFGSMLDGPDRDKLAPIVKEAFPVFLGHLSHQHPVVKDTTAWTIGKICNLLPGTVMEFLEPLMQAFLVGLKDVPKIASNVCWAIYNLAEAVTLEPQQTTSPLSRYFEGLMKALLVASERPDADQGNLLTSTYETISGLITSAAPDVKPLLTQLIGTLMHRLHGTLQGQIQGDAEAINQVQALLCGSLTVMIQKTEIEDEVINRLSDDLMRLFIQVLGSKKATVHQEALMAVGAVANRVGPRFQTYMQALAPYLATGLKNAREHHVCAVSVGVVGDIARALEDLLLPFCDDIVTILLSNLQNEDIERTVKPHIISCMGDIALAIGAPFSRYLEYVMRMLVQASRIEFQHKDYDNEEYLATLRESVLEAYTSILNGLTSEGRGQDQFAPHVNDVCQFLDRIVHSGCDDQVVRAAVGIIGDMASNFKHMPNIMELLARPSVRDLVTAAGRSEDAGTKEVCSWAMQNLPGF